MIRSENNAPDERSALRTFVADWLSVDNISITIGIGLITAGAACWSARAALVTCGALVLGLTFSRLAIEGRSG